MYRDSGEEHCPHANRAIDIGLRVNQIGATANDFEDCCLAVDPVVVSQGRSLP